MEIYSIKDLNYSYPEEKDLALKNITFEVKKGEFIVLCGASASGKTTLLRHLKPTLTPHGAKTGEIFFKDSLLEDLTVREQSAGIGFVMQSPENQIVTDKVWHELAFGLESLGYDTATIRLRVAEMASFFGIQNWFHKDINELSGGQKQLLNLAGIMTMQPSVLILDEPTSQLDPIAAADFLASLQKINRELGTTILLSEHRLEEAMPLADRVIVMDQGKIIADDAPKKVGHQLNEIKHQMFQAMPSPMRIYAGIKNQLELPMTVREGRVWLDTLVDKGLEIKEKVTKKEGYTNQEIVLEVKDAWFKYGENLADVIKGLSLEVRKGEFLAIMGGNGTGKTTMLSLLSSMNIPYRGKVTIKGKDLTEIPANERFTKLLGVLPQNPQALFVKKTVQEDLEEMLKGEKIAGEEKDFKIQKVSYLCDLNDLLERHPYDLSGGEQQRAALAKVLLLEPEILLLDEPTKGLDVAFKQQFADILKNLTEMDVSIVMVSHDIEFSAEYASRCALFFDGDIVTEGTPKEFFAGNNFYTTAANRMVRHQIADAVTVEDVILSCGGEVRKKE
ncbi:MAG: energy-coupling factor transporter ATPase, partial [Tetragenococcus halophilus]|nr:energy-coupling factor transporter ATPase [Tetragenococcus halophilus]